MTIVDSLIPFPLLTVVEGAEGGVENEITLELSSERREIPTLLVA